MSSELISSLNSQAQTTFDWVKTVEETKALVKEDAELTSTIEEAMVHRFEVRVKIGFNLIALQAEHSKDGYGDFTTVELPKLGIERTFAHRCIRVARLYENSSVASLQRTNIPALPMNRWEQLAAPSTSLAVIEQVLSGEIEATTQAIKEANEKAKELETRNKQLQSKFDFYVQDASQKEEILNETIDDLRQQLDSVSHRDVEIQEKEGIPTKTQEYIEKLESDLQERTQQRDNLAELREDLSRELDEHRDANKARREQEMYEHRINDRVKKICEAWGKTAVQLLGQLPSPIEGQVVTAANWALIDHAADMAQRIIDAIAQIKAAQVSGFLDAEVINAN